MAHLLSFRKGWQNETLARYLLSQFSFVSEPSTISDDIGSDFFCTIFEVTTEEGHKYIVPRNSFAIQIKSNDKDIDVSNKISYLEKLELPFFVGVVNRDMLSLTLYSGELLPCLFSYIGVPPNLKIRLSKKDLLNPDEWYFRDRRGFYVVHFPQVGKIMAETPLEINGFAKTLSEICSITHQNISSRINKEYIFYMPTLKKTIAFAGPGSAKTFKSNFMKRLAEVFCNSAWIKKQVPSKFRVEEFKMFEKLYWDLQNEYKELNELLKHASESAKKEIE